MYDQRAPAFRKDSITFACRPLPAEHESIHAGLPPPCHERPRKEALDLSESSDALPCQWHPTVSRPDPVAPDNATRSVSLQECHPRKGSSLAPAPLVRIQKATGKNQPLESTPAPCATRALQWREALFPRHPYQRHPLPYGKAAYRWQEAPAKDGSTHADRRKTTAPLP